MPRTPRPWFRFYSEAIDNPKLQRLDGEHFKVYVNLLCLANQGTPRGELPRVGDIAFRLRVDRDELGRQLQELRARRLLDGPAQSYRIHDWAEWQPDSDANQTPGRKGRNAERTRKERATSDVRTPRGEVEGEEDKEGEIDGDKEGEVDAPPREIEPDDGRFFREYVRKHQESHAMNPPSPNAQGEARRLETDFGSAEAMRAAEACGWDKHPNYFREWLKNPKNQKGANTDGRHAEPARSAAFEGIGT